MKEVIEDLLAAINNHDKVKNSVLGKIPNWKNNHYEILSQIINDTLSNEIMQNSESFFSMGNSVSSITVKRLYKNQIKTSAYTDLRFKKTLDKLSIFLGYESINEFIAQKKPTTLSHIEHQKEHSVLMKYLKEIIEELCKIEFNALRNLQSKDLSEFENVLMKDTPYIKRAKVYRENLNDIGAVFLEDLSNYQVYDYKIISIEEESVVLETEEFWNINFKTKTGIFPYHKRAKQIYYFKYENGKLKIWDNYNPDIGEVIGM